MSNNEKIEKAVNYLKKIGFLIEYNELDLYHGRCGNRDSVWKVETSFDNSVNTTKDNIMRIPSLCVASYDIAKSYADGTSFYGRNGRAEVYKIISNDDKSLLVNENFDLNKLSEKDRFKFSNAINSYFNGGLTKYLESLEKPDQQIMAISTNNAFLENPVEAVSNFVFYLDDRKNEKTFDFNYIKYLLSKRKIIGIKRKDRTPDSKNKDIVYIFDLAKVKAQEKDSDLEQ